jgi:Flp pilus assembly pilin Flp
MQAINDMIYKLIGRMNGSGEEGQTLVEYALIIALVSVAAVGALTALTGSIGDVFDEIKASFGV